MDKYSVTKVDIEKIKGLIYISSLIDNIYDKLFIYEIFNKKLDIEFFSSLERLKNIIRKEEEMYDELYLYLEKCQAYIDFIKNYMLSEEYTSELDTVIDQNYYDRKIARVLKTLNKILINRTFCKYNKTRDEDPSKRELLSKLKNEYEEKIMEDAFEKDMIAGFIFFLKKYIDDNKYLMFKKDLIRSKYNIGFINKELESSLLSSSFNISDTLYFSSEILSNLLKISDSKYKEIQNEYGISYAQYYIVELLNYRDEDYDSNNKEVSSILMMCMLKSSLLLLGDESKQEIKDFFIKTLSSNKYNEEHPQDILSEKIIRDLLFSQKDEIRPTILSLYNRV
ncbi:MAG: hypothetical protein RSB00_02470 [Bacilli bacterium]